MLARALACHAQRLCESIARPIDAAARCPKWTGAPCLATALALALVFLSPRDAAGCLASHDQETWSWRRRMKNRRFHVHGPDSWGLGSTSANPASSTLSRAKSIINPSMGPPNAPSTTCWIQLRPPLH